MKVGEDGESGASEVEMHIEWAKGFVRVVDIPAQHQNQLEIGRSQVRDGRTNGYNGSSPRTSHWRRTGRE